MDVNPAYAALLGRSVEETLALTYWEITPQDYAEQEQARLESLRSTDRYGPYEKECLHKDGHRLPVRLQGQIIEQQGEKFIRSSVEDISARKQAEEELRKYRDHLEGLVQERTLDLEETQAALVSIVEEWNLLFIHDYHIIR